VTFCGILPTYTLADCTSSTILSNGERYEKLNKTIMAKRGGQVPVSFDSIDGAQVHFTATNMTFEGMPTSVQFHYSTTPDGFLDLYTAGLIAIAPLLAVSGNSPFVYGQLGWRESRIALFTNGTTPERFIFGERWPQNVEELFREILDFPPLLEEKIGPSNFDIDRLPSMCSHRSTVWNWLRACYGYDEQHGPHLRTEMRVLGAGPTELDMVANAALYYGLTTRLMSTGTLLRQNVPFESIKNNFFNAAREGLESQLTWIDGTKYETSNLIAMLLPMAKEGLVELGVPAGDADFYLSVIQARVERKQTGADWMSRSLEQLKTERSDLPNDSHLAYLVQAMIVNQTKSRTDGAFHPVAHWELASYTNQ
jgi:hypothetical protein